MSNGTTQVCTALADPTRRRILRGDGDRIRSSLVVGQLALSVGAFLSAVCPEQIVLRGVCDIIGRRTAEA